VPCVAIAGGVEDGLDCAALGLAGAFSICNRPMSLEQAIANADKLLQQTTESVVRLRAE
jgi:glycerate kinase